MFLSALLRLHRQENLCNKTPYFVTLVYLKWKLCLRCTHPGHWRPPLSLDNGWRINHIDRMIAFPNAPMRRNTF